MRKAPGASGAIQVGETMATLRAAARQWREWSQGEAGSRVFELELDGTMQLSRPARPVPAAAPANPAAPAAAMPVDAVLLEQLQAMLAERDAQIAELQQAVIELANEQESAPSAISDSAPALGAVEARLAAFEAKMLEQERTIRHTLTMLIEWIEADDASRAAA